MGKGMPLWAQRDIRDGYGLVQHGNPAPPSVVNQVILAGGGKVGR